jgi:hypothetical protein
MNADDLALIAAKLEEVVAEAQAALDQMHWEIAASSQRAMLEAVPPERWREMQPHGPD